MIKRSMWASMAVILLLLLMACNTVSDEEYQLVFSRAATYANMHGFWGAWDADVFYFVDFITEGREGQDGLIMLGEINRNGQIRDLYLGGFHFHGLNAHAFFNLAFDRFDVINHAVLSEAAMRHLYFRATLDETLYHLNFASTLGDDSIQLALTFIGRELVDLEHYLANEVTLEQGLTLTHVINEMFAAWIVPIFD